MVPMYAGKTNWTSLQRGMNPRGGPHRGTRSSQTPTPGDEPRQTQATLKNINPDPPSPYRRKNFSAPLRDIKAGTQEKAQEGGRSGSQGQGSPESPRVLPKNGPKPGGNMTRPGARRPNEKRPAGSAPDKLGWRGKKPVNAETALMKLSQGRPGAKAAGTGTRGAGSATTELR